MMTKRRTSGSRPSLKVRESACVRQLGVPGNGMGARSCMGSRGASLNAPRGCAVARVYRLRCVSVYLCLYGETTTRVCATICCNAQCVRVCGPRSFEPEQVLQSVPPSGLCCERFAQHTRCLGVWRCRLKPRQKLAGSQTTRVRVGAAKHKKCWERRNTRRVTWASTLARITAHAADTRRLMFIAGSGVHPIL